MNKRFDTFSFKAPSSSEPSVTSKQEIAPLPSQINYRHTSQTIPHRTPLFDYNINSKIADIDQQLQQNIARRLQLQQQLNMVKSQERQQLQRDVFMGYNHHLYQNQEQTAKSFSNMQQRADRVDQLVKRETKIDKNDKNRQLERNKQILMTDISSIPTIKKEHIIIPILQHFDSSHKPPKVYTVPDQIKIQSLLRKVTFPQVPVGNLSDLRKQIQTLFAVHSPHSDIHYLLMVIYFHLAEHAKVRPHYQEILNFKIYNQRAHWIAAQTQFALGNHDLCLSLTEQCIDLIEEKYLPRFIFLKARSYEQTGNYVNCVVCYGQLIKLKPKIGEYYLERGVVYHRMGYYKEAKQDFVTFGLLKPEAEQLLKDKILSERNEHRKKELIAVLAKMF